MVQCADFTKPEKNKFLMLQPPGPGPLVQPRLRLEGIFRAIDENGTGIITEERLTKVLDIPKAL